MVTGAGRGIGRAIAEAISASGDGVVAFDRDAVDLEWATDRPAYLRLRSCVGDASDRTDCERAAAVADELGQLAGWVNNAAIFRDGYLHDSPEEVLAAIGVNVRLATIGSAVAINRFRTAATSGSIVNISSHQGLRPVPGALAYATAKAAIESLTRATAVDYGRDGIRANALSLGTIRTAHLERDLAELPTDARAEREAALAELHPLGRIGTPADVAGTVVFLLSDAAAFVSGAIIPIDGGRSALGIDPEARYPERARPE